MENNQKGFIVPLLLGIIAILVIGGGVYVYQNKKVEAPAVVDTEIQQADQVQQQTNVDTSNWKTYKNEEYGFELKYPVDSSFINNDFYKNYGKVPDYPYGNYVEYAGQTRNLFKLEKYGPKQPDYSNSDGGSVDDGAFVHVEITGTSGLVENWTWDPRLSSYSLSTQTLDEWLKSSLGDRHALPISINGFTGFIALDYSATPTGYSTIPSGEGAAVYKILPNGRALLITWDRVDVYNNLPYIETLSSKNYFLPILSTVKLTK